MPKYKWDVNKVYNALAQLELSIRKIQPVIDEVQEKATKLRQLKNLPQYVTQRLDNLILTNKATPERLLYGVRGVRGALPTIERTHRHKLPRLRTGSHYKVTIGGGFLARPDLEFTYFPRENTRDLFIGDILTYRGLYTLDERKKEPQPEDIFAINGFTGAFRPNQAGRVNLSYLSKAR